MKRTTTQAGTVVAALVALTLTACSGGSDEDRSLNPSEQSLADAAVPEVVRQGQGMFDQTEGKCFVDGVIKDLGVDRLNELGISVSTPEVFDPLSSGELTPAESELVVNTAADCVDLRELLTRYYSIVLPSAEAQCVTDKYDDDEVRSIVKTILGEGQGSDEQRKRNEQVLEECGADL